MSEIVLSQVVVTCKLCGTTCRTYVSKDLVDQWAAEWATWPCPAHAEKKGS